MAMWKPIDRLVIGYTMYGAGRGLRSAIAERFNISRRYAYTLMHNVERLIGKYPDTDLFSDVSPLEDPTIDRTILSLAMSCHASLEGICETLKDVYNKEMDPATVSRRLAAYGRKALAFLETVNLSGIVTCAYDEIFQCGDRPILALIDLDTHYIATMTCTDDRSAETWAIVMTLLADRGLNYQYGISDFGTGLLSGVGTVFPNARQSGDVFHAIREVGEELQKIENYAYGRLKSIVQLELAVSGPKPRQKTIAKLADERASIDDDLLRADTAMTLLSWLKELLAFPGYYAHEVKALVGWVLDEMDKIGGRTYALYEKTDFMRRELDMVLGFHDQLINNMSFRLRKPALRLRLSHLFIARALK